MYSTYLIEGGELMPKPIEKDAAKKWVNTFVRGPKPMDLSTRKRTTKISPNEMPVDLLDKDLKPFVKVVKPSSSAMARERME